MKVRKAIIPAAGLGTRFLPATKAQPKEMLPIVDKPAIQYIVEEAVNAGIEDILIITGRNKRAIEDHFDTSVELENFLHEKGKYDLLEEIKNIAKVEIHYIRQKEPRGLGHALYCARSFVGNEPFAVLLGDDIIDSETPCIRQLIEVFEQRKGSVLGVQQVAPEAVKNYGIVKIGNQRSEQVVEVADLVEKPSIDMAPSRLAILGRYVIEPEIFDILEQTTPGAGGEIQLTDALRVLAQQKPMYAYSFNGKRYDVGDKLGYLKATVEFGLKHDDLREEFLDYLKSVTTNC
jgi:UTP--glucose-1-phosphate uridylyltransferase